MKKEKNRSLKIRGYLIGPALLCMALMFLLSGCSLNNMVRPVRDYFAKEASLREASAEEVNQRAEEDLLYMKVKDSEGNILKDENGEPLTVLTVREYATGGEPRINSRGIPEIYPVGEKMTHTPGSPVIGSDGLQETYAGGEKVTDALGFALKDENGNPMTRAAQEGVTHGPDDIVYDANGKAVRYSGEPQTYKAGEIKYDLKGEEVTYPVAFQKDVEGEAMTNEDGLLIVGPVELVTDESGNPFVDENGEAATKQLNPAAPHSDIRPSLAQGTYYIRNKVSPYYFISGTESTAEASEETEQNTAAPAKKALMKMLGPDLTGMELRFDLEGYAIFMFPGTDQVLTVEGSASEGAAVSFAAADKTVYEQYKYWEDPLFSVPADQKWIMKETKEGEYHILSALNPSFALTVNTPADYGASVLDSTGFALYTESENDLQSFCFSTETPVIPRYIEEGDYYIRNGLTSWMLLSLGDGNYTDGRTAYVYMSDQGDGQQMHISYDEYGFATISHGDSSKVLSVNAGYAGNYQSVCQYEADGGQWQKWIIEPNPEDDEGYYIRSALNASQVLNLAEAVTRNETPVILYWNNNSYAQYWFFEEKAIPYGYDLATMDEYAQYFSSATDYLILVNSLSNHVGVYQGSKGHWTNLYYWDCVTGKPDTPTVKGEFEINLKLPSFDGDEDAPAEYTVYYANGFYPYYYFHSIIYYKDTKDIMDASMGYNGSHGCVRLYIENAQWIYDNIPLGTRVVSY